MNTVQAQNRYSKVYFPGENFPSIAETDSGYVVMVASNIVLNRLLIREFNNQGNLLVSDSVDFNGVIDNKGHSIHRISSNSYIFAQTVFYNGDSTRISLLKFNSKNWDTVKSAEFKFGLLKDPTVKSLEPSIDSAKFVLTGNSSIPGVLVNLDLLLAQFDTSFNLIWEKTYSDNLVNANGGIQGGAVLQSKDKGWIMSTFSDYLNSFRKGFILKTDSIGNELWRKEIFSNQPTTFNNIIEKNDGSFLSISEKVVTSQGGFPSDIEQLRFVNFDASGSVLLDTLIGPKLQYFGVARVLKLPGRDLLVLGITYDGGQSQGLIYRCTENGDSIWMRKYYYDDWQDLSQIYTGIVQKDSSIVLAGAFADQVNTQTGGIYLWLLGLDKYGCLQPGCHNIGVDELLIPKTPNFEIYPKPSSGELKITWNQKQDARNFPLDFEIIGLNGKIILKRKINEHSGKEFSTKLPGHISNGTYIIVLSSNEKVLLRDQFSLMR